MRFYKGNADVTKSFKLVKNDGVTPINTTGLTITWVWRKRDGTTVTGSPITGLHIDDLNGLIDFTIPATCLATVAKYISFINGVNGSYDEDFEPINVEVVKGSDG